jgi:tape measure domain-containing protein
MTTIGFAVLEVIPSLRGVSDALDKASRGLKITPKIDTSGAARAGQDAGRQVQAGMDSQASGGLRRFLTFDGARSSGQQAGNEVNAGLQSADIGRGVSSSLGANLLHGAESAGRNLGSLIVTGLKATAIAGGAVAAVGLAGALHAGFSRLTAIDDARFKLQGLGNDTAKVQSIMDNALASVKGTAFGLDEAATTAASAVAAGIQPGKQLTDYLKLTADTASIAGTSLADMGSIFNKIQTSGKAFTGDLDQLSQRGLPVFQWLQDEYKVSGEELSKMVSSGKVDAATFQKVVAEHISGAAQTMGGSIRGQLSNLKASYSRFGAELAGPIFAAVSPLTKAFTGAFDKVTTAIKPFTAQLTAIIGPWATDLGNKITAWLDNGGVQKIADWFGRLKDTFAGLTKGGGSGALKSISDSVKGIGPALQQAGPALSSFGQAMGAFGKAIVAVGPQTLTDFLVPALKVFGGALKFVADNASWAIPVIGGLVLAFGGFKAVGDIVSPIFNALNGAFKIINTPVMLAQTLAIRAQAAAMTELTAALGVNTVALGENAVAQDVEAASTGRLTGLIGAGATGLIGGVLALSAALGVELGFTIFDKMEQKARDAQAAIDETNRKLHEEFPGQPVTPAGVPAQTGSTAPNNPLNPNNIYGPGRAAGGMISGFSTTDDRLGLVAGHGLIGLAGGEGIINARSTRRLGGAPFINFLNGFAGGGVVPPDVAAAQALVGTAYSQANRTDCSGTVARVIDRTLGLPEVGLMSTKNAADWLAARGFKKGTGGPGMISVGWYDHGPNLNDGHMAMTLSDGRNAEAGGSVGVFTVGGSVGASSPQFDQHMFLPTVYGEGPAGPSSASPFAGGSAVTGGGTPPPSVRGGGTSSSSGGAAGGFSLPSSISGLASFGLDDLGKGVGKTGSGSDLSLFGKAAGSAVSGQVDSLLGVFGVPGTPGWLKAASMLVSGIKVGGGSSAAPLSATPTISGTPPPDDPGNMHGSRAGQAPGPQTVYNIRTATVEDAFLAAQRKQNERNAAKLSRF